jgi:hypothetical protein
MKQCFLCIFVALRVVINYTKALSVAAETPERVPFALSLTYKIFRTAGNNVNVLRSSYKYTILLSDFNQVWNLSTDFLKVPNITSHENPFSEGATMIRADSHE